MPPEKSSCSNSQGDTSTVTRSAAPIWIILVTLVLLFVGGYYFDQHSGWFDPKVYAPYSSAEKLQGFQPQSGAAASMAKGKASRKHSRRHTRKRGGAAGSVSHFADASGGMKH